MPNRRAVHQRVRVPGMAVCGGCGVRGGCCQARGARSVRLRRERGRDGEDDEPTSSRPLGDRRGGNRCSLAMLAGRHSVGCGLSRDLLGDEHGYSGDAPRAPAGTRYPRSMARMSRRGVARAGGDLAVTEPLHSCLVLVCSGDLASLQEHATALSTHGCAVLPMPFDLDNLLRVIDAAIAADRQVLSWKIIRAHGGCIQMDRATGPDSTGDARSQTYGGVAASHEMRLVT